MLRNNSCLCADSVPQKFSKLTAVSTRAPFRSQFWQPKMKVVLCVVFVVLLATLPSVRGGCAIRPDANGHVNIPYGETSIGNEAFRDCSSLISITLPDSLQSIGWFAFFSSSKGDQLGRSQPK